MSCDKVFFKAKGTKSVGLGIAQVAEILTEKPGAILMRV